MKRTAKDTGLLREAVLSLSIFLPGYKNADRYKIKVLNLVTQDNLDKLNALIDAEKWEDILNDLTTSQHPNYEDKPNRLFENRDAATKMLDELLNCDFLPLSYCLDIINAWYHYQLQQGQKGKGWNYKFLRIPINRKDLPASEIESLVRRLQALQLILKEENRYEVLLTHFLDHPNMPEHLIQEQISNLRKEKVSAASSSKWEYILKREDIEPSYFFDFIRIFHIENDSIYWTVLLRTALANPAFPAEALQKLIEVTDNSDYSETQNLYPVALHKNCPPALAFEVLESYRKLRSREMFKEITLKNLDKLESKLDYRLKELGYDNLTLASMPTKMKAEIVLW